MLLNQLRQFISRHVDVTKWYHRYMHVKRKLAYPPVGNVDFGDFHTLKPFSQDYGFDRGRPVDRYYIEAFLDANRDVIQGRVLEFGDDRYTREFGDPTQVELADVLSPVADSLKATIIADLTQSNDIPDKSFDCIICTQVLQFVSDFETTLDELFRILKPDGTLLLTVAGISQLIYEENATYNDYWRFTRLSLEKLLLARFGTGQVSVESKGNILTAISFLHGLAVEDLPPEAFETHDPHFEVILTARATRKS